MVPSTVGGAAVDPEAAEAREGAPGTMSLRQCLQTRASGCTHSAQNGHFRDLMFGPNQITIQPIGPSSAPNKNPAPVRPLCLPMMEPIKPRMVLPNTGTRYSKLSINQNPPRLQVPPVLSPRPGPGTSSRQPDRPPAFIPALALSVPAVRTSTLAETHSKPAWRPRQPNRKP